MDLNHRQMLYHAFTVSFTIIVSTGLPTELHNKLESESRIELLYCSFAESRLATWPHGHKFIVIGRSKLPRVGDHLLATLIQDNDKLVRNVGVEPTTEPWQSPVLPLN